MPDTPTSTSGLQALFADNTTGAITPQDLRDFVVSVGNIVDGIDPSKLGTGSGNITLTPLPASGFTEILDYNGNPQLTVTTSGVTAVTDFSCNGTVNADNFVGAGTEITEIDPSQLTSASAGIILQPGDSSPIILNDSDGNERLTVFSAPVQVGFPVVAVNGLLSATTFSGSGANLTSLPASQLTGSLPAISGASLTNLPAANLTGTLAAVDGHQLTNLIVPQNSQSANYTTVQADSGRHILHPSSDTTARTFTIAANSSVAYTIGTTLTFINAGSAGTITIAINSDTLILAGSGSTGSRTLAPYGIATAIKITSTSWLINGTNLT